MISVPAPPRSLGYRALGRVVGVFERMSAVSGRSRVPAPPVSRELPVRVVEVRALADRVVGVTLAHRAGTRLPVWRPGAHLDVRLPGGLLRQYSLCGDPREPAEWQMAARLLGAGSSAVHALRPGDELTVLGPRNAFPYLEVPRYLFVAGGIGITAIRPMVLDAARRGAEWHLVYTGSTRAAMPFADELHALDRSRVHLRPDDESGRPDPAAILVLAPPGAALYVCGPPGLTSALRARAEWPRISTVHSERFSPAPVLDGAPFTVRLARTGWSARVAADESALQAVRRLLPDVPYSCRQGFCGTCIAPVLAGTPIHRDRCLTPTLRDHSMALCVSRADGTLVLDL